MITVRLASQTKTLVFPGALQGSPSIVGALQVCSAVGAIGDSAISVGSITGTLTFSKSGTTDRTATFPDATITVAGINLAQTWTATQTFAAIGATTVSASGAITCAGLTSSGANGQFLVQNGSTAGGMRLTAFNAAGNANGYLQFEGYSSVYGKINADGTWVIGPSDPGGSEPLRVGGGARIAGSSVIGDGSGSRALIINGGSSGTSCGAAIYFQHAGSAIMAAGAYSAIYGGAFNAEPTMYTAANGMLMDGGIRFNNGTSAAGKIIFKASDGLHIRGATGLVYDLCILNAAGTANVFGVPTGTSDVVLGASGGKHGFYGTPGVTRSAAAAAATDAATTQALANSLRTILINLGLAS